MPQPAFRIKALWNGQLTISIEEWLKNRSWLIHGTAAKYREWAFQLAGRTPSSIVAGKNDWLFLPVTVQPRTEELNRKQATNSLKYLLPLKQRFEVMGMKIVVLLIPNAANLFPEQTPDWVRGEKERLAFLKMFFQSTSRIRHRGV